MNTCEAVNSTLKPRMNANEHETRPVGESRRFARFFRADGRSKVGASAAQELIVYRKELKEHKARRLSIFALSAFSAVTPDGRR